MLPLLGNWAGQVWTSDAVSVAPVQPLFKQRYTDIYNGNVAVPAYVAPTRRTQFGYNLSKYFRSLLADESSYEIVTFEDAADMPITFSPAMPVASAG